jgi:hypothetical protein
MKFVEDTGANWAAIQIKAVEMEIEQQKREWEEKRLAQQQQEELDRQKAEKEESEMLTYSREDAMNKVNIKSNKKVHTLGKRKSENSNHSVKTTLRNKSSSNGTVTRNGIVKDQKGVRDKKNDDSNNETRRTTRNASRTSINEDNFNKSKHGREVMISQRATSRKSDRSGSSISKKTTIRSTSESTRSTSISRQTSVQEDSDSECSLDVMIDSNDVNDSDSNSNHNSKVESNFDSTSQEQDDDTLLNDDSTITDETTIECIPKMLKNEDQKSTSSPRTTRSRGTVAINLWSLDESPILPPKRQKILNNSKSSETRTEQQLKLDYSVKECKVELKRQKPIANNSPQSRTQKRLMLSAKSNQTLDSWVQKIPEPMQKPKLNESEKNEENAPKTRARRQNPVTANKTL